MEVPNSVELTNEWIPKFTFGISRSFDLFDVEDRVSLTLETYYNGAGYTNLNLDTKARQQVFFQGGYYHPGEMGQWYGACFLNIRELILSELSGNLNTVVNFTDGSALITSGLTYVPIDHFTLSLGLTGAIGEDNREYTLSANGLKTDLSVGIIF